MALSGFVFWQDKFLGLMTFTLFLPFALDEIKAMFWYIAIFFIINSLCRGLVARILRIGRM